MRKDIRKKYSDPINITFEDVPHISPIYFTPMKM